MSVEAQPQSGPFSQAMSRQTRPIAIVTAPATSSRPRCAASDVSGSTSAAAMSASTVMAVPAQKAVSRLAFSAMKPVIG